MTIPSADVLVTQCIKGDKLAYKLLYERYAKAMYNTALRISGNGSDAEDILQEAFIDAFQQLKSFEKKSTFGAWLKKIVVFKSIALLKKRRLSFVEINEQVHEWPEQKEDENNVLLKVQNIKKALAELPYGYRTVLTLYLIEGYDHEEIAGILDVATSTVRTQYIRGKQKLIELLKKEIMYE